MKDVRLELAALLVSWVLTLTLGAALVAVLAGSGTPVTVLLAGGLLLTAPPAVWLLTRAAKRQELDRERAKLAARKDGPAVAQDVPTEQPKALGYS